MIFVPWSLSFSGLEREILPGESPDTKKPAQRSGFLHAQVFRPLNSKEGVRGDRAY
ncbi:hypothetical protein LEP1GSC185_2079 [Leptospira licerasiae serovar Varillal str. VAR 010]|uniref:Uncharacterized protein n=1 Tax=Leptospira licerasiae str. MMD4847 TaxID=1049971 RepID=A0ABN0H4F5_9LEPT|nr:hypothetical protein LEP1GSC185_2079 [Leptospira licerasiae serovar Varillal str. VAR 010]EJZ40679.1 hypothetical protein LEP1GSC178_1349 [Leptospira licerasiae str. MMD4847]